MISNKNSEVEWIGKIPNNWELIKGRYLFVQRNEKGNNNTLQLLSPTQKYGVIPQSMYEELSGMGAVKLNEKTDLNLLKTIHKGDFCISLRSFQGGFELSEYEGVCSPAYQVFYAVGKVSNRYYKYLFKETSFIEKINSYTLSLRDGKNIAFSDFGNTYLPVPPIEIQEKIAKLLDDKCLEIDLLYSDIENQIKILEEYKKSLITEVVTKGLNPEVEMKDSGIYWIGMVPKEWKKQRLINLAADEKYSIVDGPFGSDMKNEEYTDEGIPIVQLTNIKPFNHYTEELKFITEEKSQQLKRHSAYQGDIVIAKMMPAGRACILKNDYVRYVVAADAIRYKCSENVNKHFILYCLNTYCMTECEVTSKGTTRVRISLDIARRLTIFLPSDEEQIAIVTYLDSKCDEINSAIANKKDQLKILEEYKKTLIYEYVTGKKEVST